MKRKLLPFIVVFLIFTIAAFQWFSKEIFFKNPRKWNQTMLPRLKKLGDYIDISEVLSSQENVLFPLQCETCALVGTSGHLLEHRYGSEIDENHSCVFRFGFSPTRGYEDYVGRRTTARVVDSYRFYPFLKKPLKLVTGPFASEFWFLFDRTAGDITRYHGPLLQGLLEKHDTRFLWFSRQAEREVQSSLARAGRKQISSLWFTTRVIEDSGCKTINIYGIPDSRICKRHLNVSTSSLYWDTRYAKLCSDGVDASYKLRNTKTMVSPLPTIVERRMLPNWAKNHFSNFNFKAPKWNS